MAAQKGVYEDAHQVAKWMLPMCFAAFGFYLQSVGLHYATYQYIHKYAMPDELIPPSENPYATLADPVEEAVGHKMINIHFIDTLAAAFPGTFVMVSAAMALAPWFYGAKQKSTVPAGTTSTAATRGSTTSLEGAVTSLTSNSLVVQQARSYQYMSKNMLVVWTKVMLCAGFLFSIKGLLGAVTTVPDSSGWKVCRARLGDPGVSWMREEHSFSDFLTLDAYWLGRYHKPLRYCSDMMYSGHTFVVTLFALGLYELIRVYQITSYSLTKKIGRQCLFAKMASLTALSILTIGEQAFEIYTVEVSRFHYTMDVVMALLMVFLFFTNGVIAVSAKLWATDGLKLMNPSHWANQWENSSKDLKSNDEEDPHLYEVSDEDADEWSKFVSRGDIFVPPCCVPCCCLAGREHIYSDEMVKELVQHHVQKIEEKDERKLFAFLKTHMNLDEGISLKSFHKAVKNVGEIGDAAVTAGYSRLQGEPDQQVMQRPRQS